MRRWRDASRRASHQLILYSCPWAKRSAGWHPCGIAAKALDEAGHTYEIREVRGQLSMPWTWPSRRRDRAEIRQLSGQNGVPVLVVAGHEAVAGSRRITCWAAEHAARGSAARVEQTVGGPSQAR